MNKIALITAFLIGSFFLFSCNNNATKTTIDKEKELLEKELELTKKELELSKKESEVQAKKQEQVRQKEDVATDILDDPVKIMQTIFTAAKTKDFSKLSGLCDPTGGNDGDTKSICNIELQSLADQKEFIEYFQNGNVIGNTTIIGNMAGVKFNYGPKGDIEDEMNFVKINEKWYLSHF